MVFVSPQTLNKPLGLSHVTVSFSQGVQTHVKAGVCAMGSKVADIGIGHLYVSK
jgi:hypothetical protein